MFVESIADRINTLPATGNTYGFPKIHHLIFIGCVDKVIYFVHCNIAKGHSYPSPVSEGTYVACSLD